MTRPHWGLIPLDVRETSHPDYPAWELFRELPPPDTGDDPVTAAWVGLIAWTAYAGGYQAGAILGMARGAIKATWPE